MSQHHTSAFHLKSLEEDGLFVGYASVFDYIDWQNDQVIPGAFSKSLESWRTKADWPKMLWQHDHHHPIGVWLDMQEDATGLLVKGQLLLELQKGREAYALIKRKIVNGLSIGFSIKTAITSPQGHQLLHEVHLHEVSLVTFAANPKAKVEWVKQANATKTNDNIAHINDKGEQMTLEQAENNNNLHEIHHKTLERPVFSSSQRAINCLNNFVKYGEKALSSQDGTGSLIIRKPNIAGIVTKPTSPTLFRNVAKQTIIQSDHLEIVREKTNADCGWANETRLGEETNLGELFKILIPAHEMYARTRISQRLLDDAVINLESWLIESIEQRFNQLEEDAFVNGSGEQMPKGFLAYERVEEDALEWGKLAERRTGNNGEIGRADILLDTVASLKTPYLSGAVWVMSRSAFAEIRRLKDPSTGRYLWQPSLQESGGNILLGFPIVISDAMPALKADRPVTPIAFGNFTLGYQIVDRGEFTILRDPYSAKPLVEFYVTQRLGGDVVDFEAIKLITTGE